MKKMFMLMFTFLVAATVRAQSPAPVKQDGPLDLLLGFYMDDFKAGNSQPDTIEKTKDYAIGAAKVAGTVAVIKMLNDNKFDPIDFYLKDFKDFSNNKDTYAATISLVKGTAKVVGTVVAVQTIMKIAKDRKEALAKGREYDIKDSGLTESDLKAAQQFLQELEQKKAQATVPAK